MITDRWLSFCKQQTLLYFLKYTFVEWNIMNLLEVFKNYKQSAYNFLKYFILFFYKFLKNYKPKKDKYFFKYFKNFLFIPNLFIVFYI